MFTCFNRFGSLDIAALILRKISKHEDKEKCEVCQKEETKSPSLKINGAKILEKVFLLSNQCWICDMTFENSESQVNHFTENHECDFCNVCFKSSQERKEHILDKHKCQICGKYFEYDFQKEEHIEEEHSNQDPFT